jgi:hypothetical protein
MDCKKNTITVYGDEVHVHRPEEWLTYVIKKNRIVRVYDNTGKDVSIVYIPTGQPPVGASDAAPVPSAPPATPKQIADYEAAERRARALAVITKLALHRRSLAVASDYTTV